jgi:hypothetical protein
MRKRISLLIISSFISVNLTFADDTSASGASPVQAVTQAARTPEAWEARRAQFVGIVQGAQHGDAASRTALDGALTEFEAMPLDRTPMENLDILGVFYVPKDGVEKALPVIVMNQVLGWYDVLRFGTESGRAEIVHNEGFFKRPFVLAGADSIRQMSILMPEHPDQVAAAVRQGVSFAEKFKDSHAYDDHWPTAYGLERMICAQGGNCATPASLPKDQWPGAWQAAKQGVLAYYVPPVGQTR